VLLACAFASVALVSCSVDTEMYRFVDVSTLDAGATGCANPACTECLEGFKKGGSGCVDVNECEEDLDECDDGPDACVNREEGLGYVCECPMGYEGNGFGEDGCIGTTPCPDGTLDIKGDASECYRPFSAVALGDAHGCGVRGGQLVCWGDGADGRLGLGVIEEDPPLSRKPEQVGEAEDWESAELGGAHSCALRAGELHCFGANAQGQLGAGNTDEQLAPVRSGTQSGFTIIAAGARHTCGLVGDLLHCWGDNAQGQAGLGEEPSVTRPTRVEDAGGWTALSAGAQHTCGVRSGSLLCWGDNASGQLGLGDSDARSIPTEVGTDTDWTAVAAGDRHSCGVRANMLFCWGDNAGGQLGLGDTDARNTPTQVGSFADWMTIAAGGAHSCGLGVEELRCWGDNAHGQLGVSDVASSLEPTAIAAIDDSAWEQIALAADQSCALAAGLLFCWGDNTGYRLGVPGPDSISTIELVR
jgi:alpha-tubulin suppressor-like RCC1 family protein